MAYFDIILNPNQYFLNPYAIPSFLVASVALALGFFIYLSDRFNASSRCFLYLSLNAAIWLISSGCLLNSLYYESALFWGHILFSALSLMSAIIYHFSAVLTQKVKQQQKLIKFTYIEAIVIMLLSWSYYSFSGIQQGFFGVYPKAGLLISILVLFVAVCSILSFINLIHYHFTLKDSSQRKQARFLMLSFLILQFAFIDIFTSYNISTYPLGYIVLLGFLLSMTCFKLGSSFQSLRERAKQYEVDIERKSREVSELSEKLQTTQEKLLETGKVSVLASLSAGILHSISQPITAIHGFTRFLIKEMKEDEKFYRPICLIEEQSVYLKQMLEDLMDLIRHREIRKDNTNVNEVIERSIKLLKDEMRIQRINWDLDLAENLPSVFADSLHLQQIFMNIVINAIQALSTLNRGADRYIKISSEFSQQDNAICVSIKDTGPGINESDKHRIFEPFFSTKSTGAGIGLSLCQDLIAEHGGRMSVESQSDTGAKFIIWLPCSPTIKKL